MERVSQVVDAPRRQQVAGAVVVRCPREISLLRAEHSVEGHSDHCHRAASENCQGARPLLRRGGGTDHSRPVSLSSCHLTKGSPRSRCSASLRRPATTTTAATSWLGLSSLSTAWL